MKGLRHKGLLSQRKSSITGHSLFNEVTRLAELPFSKFASNYAAYKGGDTFLSDIRYCLQLPVCDQLVILDGSSSLKAFTVETVKNRKFDLLASAGYDVANSGANLSNWLTRTLIYVLERLLNKNPEGFSTSDVYRELYYTVPFDKPCKPLLFDQASHDLGRIWLRPQVQYAPPESQENRSYLRLGLKLDGDPELPMMTEILSYLQRLPHVEQIELGDLSSPRDRLTDLMRVAVQARKIRPLIRRIVARRRLRRIADLRKADPHDTIPSSLLKLSLEQNYQPTYHWSKYMHYDDTPNVVKVEDSILDAQAHLGDRKRPLSPDSDQG